MVDALAQRREDRGSVGCVAERDGDVSQPALVAGAADRAAFGALRPFRFGPTRTARRARRRRGRAARAKSPTAVGVANLFHGQKSWQSSQPKIRLPIGARSCSGIDAAQLDREIRDAAPRVELIRRDDRLRRADVETSAARAAVLGRRARSTGSGKSVNSSPSRNHEPASRSSRFVCLPIQPRPGVARERFLEDRGAVDEHAVAERRLCVPSIACARSRRRRRRTL